MKLQTKIHKGMMLLITVTLLVSYSIFTYIIYRQTVNMSIHEVRQEAQHIKRLLAVAGNDFLHVIDTALSDTRISIIDKQGNILYDSNMNTMDIDFENHLLRPEVQEALAGKIAEDIRTSETFGTKMFYYAEMVDNNILRIAKEFDAMWITALRILPVMLAAACIMFIIAYILAKILVNKIIVPVNQINLTYPLERKNYDEIMPLLVRIEKQNMEKEKIDTIRKEFSANVSHELKTPLTSISGYAELIKDGIVQKEDIENFGARIYFEAQRLIVLIDKIMLLSKLDEEKLVLDKEEVDLYPLLLEICNRLNPFALEKNVRIELTGENIKISGFRYMLDEMLYNLCENAIKYNKEHGTVKIWLGTVLTAKRIIIEDTGIGIDEQEQERIFERFYRADKSHNSKISGSGLGLSIVKYVALLHTMQIKLESEPEKGTKFILEF